VANSQPISSDAGSLVHRGAEGAVQWQRSIEQDYQSHHDFRTWDSNSPDHERTQAASDLLHLNSGGPIVELAQTLSPNATIYPDSSIAESGEATVAAFTPPDAAFSRWFGLLTSDAAHVNGGVIRFGRTVNDTDHDHVSAIVQGVCALSPEQRAANFINDREVASIHRLPDLNLERGAPPELGQNHFSQRQPWHGSEPSRLNSHEQVLFENYVKQSSTWVK
jgi:hypothetical protein